MFWECFLLSSKAKSFHPLCIFPFSYSPINAISMKVLHFDVDRLTTFTSLCSCTQSLSKLWHLPPKIDPPVDPHPLLDAMFAHCVLGCLCVLMRVHGCVCVCVCAHVCVRVSIRVWLSVRLLRIVQIWRIVFRHSQCMLTKQRTHPRGSIVNMWTQICSSPSRYVSANNSWVIHTPCGL